MGEAGVESYIPKQEQFQSEEREYNRKIMGKLGHRQFVGEQSNLPVHPQAIVSCQSYQVI